MARLWLIIVLIAGSGLLSGCGRDGFASGIDESYRHAVAVMPVVLETGYSIEREFAGVVDANQVSELGFELPGRVAELRVDEGDTVEPGQLLAVLDQSLLRSQRAELQARRDSLDAELELAQRNLQRIEELQSRQLASERERDELASRTQVLQAALRESTAALQANQLRLDKSELRSPFAARIGARRVDVGVVVDAGTPVFNLVESGVREVQVGIPARLANGLQTGQEVRLRNREQQASGRILSLGATVSAATRTQQVRVAVDMPWTPGELAYVLLHQAVELPGVWVPDTAVTEGLRGTWVVYVAEPEGDASAVLQLRSVVVHHGATGRLYVTGALQPGDLLVTGGLHRLAPGQSVRVTDSSVFVHVP